MASQLYPKGKKKILDGDIDLLADEIRVAIIDTADETYNSADEFYSHIAAAAIVAFSPGLTGKTTTDGVFDANNIAMFGSNITGDSVEAVVMYKWTGNSTTSPLIAWLDVTAYTPTGTGVTVNWHASGIFAI